MKIRFTNSKRVNFGRYQGIDLAFFYRINDEDVFHKLTICTKYGGNMWDENLDILEYSRKAFPQVVKFTESFWEKNNKLPDETTEYTLSDFELSNHNKELEWLNYQLILRETK